MKIHLSNRHVFLFLAIVMLLFACNNNRKVRDLQDYITKLKASNNTTVKVDVSSFQPPQPVIYKFGSSRAPFESSEKSLIGKNAISNPLEAYSISTLRFVGTISQDDTTAGYILTPDNKVYSVKPGDTIGDHGGKIKTIRADRIEVIEIENKDNKQDIQHLVTLQLKE